MVTETEKKSYLQKLGFVASVSGSTEMRKQNRHKDAADFIKNYKKSEYETHGNCIESMPKDIAAVIELDAVEKEKTINQRIEHLTFLCGDCAGIIYSSKP